MRILISILLSISLFNSALFAASFTIEAETMTLSGPYAGTISSPFSGIALYGNGDKGTTSNAFVDGIGVYNVSIRGASNNSNAAGVSLYINNVKVKAFTFYGTTATVLEAEVKLSDLNQGSNTIELILETDNGSSDTFIDKITFSFLRPIVVKDPPVLPAEGAYYTGIYRNMLEEAGYTNQQINQRLDYLWNRLFYGDPETEAVYYPVGTDEAYILDSGNNDVRSEGMSYGMMICVQLDKQEEFNRLWKWTKTHMQHQSGARKGYFAWQVGTNGNIIDVNTAADGEEYFIMALMFASARWGDGEGMFDYWGEANYILDMAMNKENPIHESITNLFNATHKQVVFTPYASAANFTNPSYHLPAFYELWGKWADKRRSFWLDVASKSREMFHAFAHPQTGLMPDYANFDGTPTGGSHAEFRYDAWRAIMNVAVDYAWFKTDNNQVELANRLLSFFESKGIDSYGSEFTLAGNQLNSDHSPGLVGCNGTATLASDQSIAWEFIDDFFYTDMTTGKYRYYDGLLYFLSYLHLSGNFKIYEPENIGEDEPGSSNDEEQIAGYYIIDSFDTKPLNTPYDMYKQNGASAGTALVALSPTDDNEHAAHVMTANYDEYIQFTFSLPAGRVLSDYDSFDFDVYYNSNAPNADNHYKELYVYFNNVLLLQEATGDKNGSNHNVWLNKSLPLNNINNADEHSIRISIRSPKADFYVDNIRLKEDPSIVSNYPVTKINHYYLNEILYLNSKVDELSIYNLSGNLLLTERNISDINIKQLPVGAYIVLIHNEGKHYQIKLVKYF